MVSMTSSISNNVPFGLARQQERVQPGVGKREEVNAHVAVDDQG